MTSSDNRIITSVIIKARQIQLGFFISLMILSGCETKSKIVVFTGNTMGTTYSVKVIPSKESGMNERYLKTAVDSVLEEINRQMSTYLQDSEISQFNRSESVQPFSISQEFHTVLSQSIEIAQLTGGAFDITIMPLVDLWGFGPDSVNDRNNWQPPDSSIIANLIGRTGINLLQLGEESVTKLHKDLQIDLNAIAKGFGVDMVVELLLDQGLERFMVEIGGEVRCQGLNQSQQPWQIGIEQPALEIFANREIVSIAAIHNQAIATSGDYRNFFESAGTLYSHIIDPRTGYPVQTKVASASVIAPTCALADALATGLLILGEEEGMKLIESLENIEAMMIIRGDQDQFQQVLSSGFNQQ